MFGCERYIVFNVTGTRFLQGLRKVAEVETARPARRTVSGLGLLAQVSARWLQLEGKKPWRRCMPDCPAVQRKNRPPAPLVTPMTRRALTAGGLSVPLVDRLSVSGALLLRIGLRRPFRGGERIGKREPPRASAPA